MAEGFNKARAKDKKWQRFLNKARSKDKTKKYIERVIVKNGREYF